MDLRISGANDLGDVARALRMAGNKTLRKELYSGLQRATKPLKADAQRAAASRLPQRGGLAARIAKTRIATSIRTGRDPSVSITAKDSAAASADKGFVRHPVFGDRGAWVTQQVQPGWFTATMQAAAPSVRAELTQAIENVADQIRRA